MHPLSHRSSDVSKKDICCKIQPKVKNDFGCQVCWLKFKGDTTIATREECNKKHMHFSEQTEKKILTIFVGSVYIKYRL